MFERFTAPAREAVVRAQREAQELGHPMVGTEHLLLALMADAGPAGAALTAASAVTGTFDVARVRAEIERRVTHPQALLGEDDAAALRSIGIDLDAVLDRIEESFGPDALRPPPARGWFGRGSAAGRSAAGRSAGRRFGPRTKKVLELSLREATRRQDPQISSGHLLLGLIREGDGLAARILVDAGIDLADLRARTEQALRTAA